MIEEHKASKDPEPLTITGRTMKTMLTACGVPGEKAEKFEKACAEQFGADAALSPRNLVETKKFEIETPECKFALTPSNASGSRRATLTVHRTSSFPPARACR